MKHIVITGGAGFIGCNIAKRLLEQNFSITIYDNFSTCSSLYKEYSNNKNIKTIRGDINDTNKLTQSLKGADLVYHLAANADVRKGLVDTSLDFKQSSQGTLSILQAMRVAGVKKLIFPSSMTIYGLGNGKPIAESFGPCMPISLYAGNKLAAEGIISAFSHTFGIQSLIIRLANIVGPGMTHGVIFDLVNKLIANPKKIKVLGDGTQKKPYLHIEDMISAIFLLQKKVNSRIAIYNVGSRDSVTVKTIVSILINVTNSNPTIEYTLKTRGGWIGDVPEFNLNSSKLYSLGFKQKFSSIQAIESAVRTRLTEVRYNVS